MIALLLAPLLTAASPIFAPPEGPAFRYVVERTTDGSVPRRFRVERRVSFAHDDQGVIADITMERTEQVPDDGIADLFARGNAPFLGRTLRFRFARDGSVRAVDDADAIFAAMIGALSRTAAAPLEALSPERRRAMVAGIAQPFLAGADVQVASGIQRVTIASASPGGSPIRLVGTRIVARDGQGRVVVTVHASAEGIVLDRVRIVDPATGLVLEERETRLVTIGTVAQTSHSTTTFHRMVL